MMSGSLTPLSSSLVVKNYVQPLTSDALMHSIANNHSTVMFLLRNDRIEQYVRDAGFDDAFEK